MDVELAERLAGPEGVDVLAAAAELAGLDPLTAGLRLRKDHDPELAAAALHEIDLRSRAAVKFGQLSEVLLTRDGLEQATRGVVARWRAQTLLAHGVRRIVDLGCGLGSDALACAEAGIEVVAVEKDPVTAVFARHNLAGVGVEVLTGAAEDLAPSLLDKDVAVMADPARRTGKGRSWQVNDFTPSYEWVVSLVCQHGGVAKFGPGTPYELVPEDLEAVWVSESGDAVEVSLWGDRVPSAQKGRRRSAVVLPGGDSITVEPVEPTVGPVGGWLVEPDPAVIRAGAVDTLAKHLGGRRIAGRIAYLTCDAPVATPYGTVFEVVESFAWKEKALRAWVRDRSIGTLEIKKRGIQLDPAQLRKRLKLSGPHAGTVVITPTTSGAQVLVVRRLRA